MAKDIETTIKYGKKFGVNYSDKEIERRLICSRTYDKKLLKDNIRTINKKNLPSLFGLHLEEKLEKARRLAKLIERFFPGILMITVTGSVAAGYCKRNDDIDLMIVTKNNQLWINRLLLRIMVWIGNIPHRRYGQKEKSNEFCFNLWLEEGNMQLPKEKQILRNAMDSILMIPILDRGRIHARFFGDNKWIENHTAQTYKKISKLDTKIKTSFLDIISPISWINWVVFWPQYWYMKGRIKQEIVDLRSAFFHPSDKIRHAIKNRR